LSDANGKPKLDLANDRHLRFNLSHSGDYVLIAFARHRDIGIDVEVAQHKINIAELADHLFAPRELTTFGLLPLSEQSNEFIRCWCRKEAFVKALGLGLSIPLPAFELLATDPMSPGPRRIATARFNADGWRVWDICLDDRHMAALAVEGPVSALRVWTLSAKPTSDAAEALVFNCETRRTDGLE